MTLRTRILCLTFGLLFFFGITVAIFIETEFAGSLSRELQKRGVSIAKHIAEQSAGAIVEEDVLSLRLIARDRMKSEEDIVYIFFLSEEGDRVLSHSFGESFPVDLLGANRLSPDRGYGIRTLSTEYGPVYDIAVPVLNGALGQVRVGMSGEPIESAVRTIAAEILSLTVILLVLGAAVAIPLSRAVSGPIRRLAEAAEEIAAGCLDGEVFIHRRDEVGDLSVSFNRMVQNLKKARTQLEDANAELAEEVARRSRAEDLLAEQLLFLERLMDEIPSPIFFKDSQGIFLGCNKAFEAFYGVSRSAIVGNPFPKGTPVEQMEIHLQANSALLQKPGTTIYEGSVVRADGSERTIIFHKASFAAERCRPICLVGVLQDVTKEREAARLKDDFVSTAAHEFQTPLAAILGFSELLIDQEQFASEEARDYLAIIYAKAELLSRIVDDLLDISRIEVGHGLSLHLGPCRISETIGTVVDGFRKRSHRHRFEVRFSEEGTELFLDQERIVQVLENLLSNAVKYSPNGGIIRVIGARGEDFYKVVVEDEGKGMSGEEIAQVFDKFYRADTSDTAPSGTGLGMAIVKSIIELHHGTIDIFSTPGRGTRVEVTLPATAAFGSVVEKRA